MNERTKREISKEELIRQNKQLMLIAIIAIIVMFGFMIISLYGYNFDNIR